MAQATQLDATEQDTLVKQIGLSLLRAAPRDWQRVTAEYRALGRFHELTGEIVMADGSAMEWVATHDIATLFGKLRAGMYREGRGTWFNARYQLDAPSSYNLEYDREEPAWDIMPPAQAYADELRMYPRSEDNVPEWLMRRMSGLGPEQPGPRFRIARIFDGVDQAGRPIIDRAELDLQEQDRVLGYLDSAPVVVPGRGYDLDRLATNQESRVPVAFHSDGVWIWPAAVNYYLREYGVAPESDLLSHIHANRFIIPEVPDAQRGAAAAYVTRGPGPAQPQQASQDRHAAMPPGPAGQATEQPPAERNGFEHPGSSANGSPAAGVGGPVIGAERTSGDHLDEDYADDRDDAATYSAPATANRHVAAEPATTFTPAPTGRMDPDPATTFTPAADLDPGPATTMTSRVDLAPQQQPGQEPEPIEQGHPVLDELRATLDELGVPGSGYRIGAPAAHGWSLEQVDSGWRVGWYDEKLTNPAVFGDIDDAAAFMLGKLLLAPDGRAVAPLRSEQTVGAPEEPQAGSAAPEPPPAPTPDVLRTTLSPEVATGERPPPQPQAAPPQPPPPQQAPPQSAPPQQAPESERRAASAGQGAQQWPIQPLPGEPPLTLFRGKEVRELPAGSELDRFGGPNGNLTYAAGTPFEERSLVPEWVNRPYHVYRVRRPLESLAGVAIPWFDQPGGGAAYLLPASIDELLAEGDLIELEPGEPPVD